MMDEPMNLKALRYVWIAYAVSMTVLFASLVFNGAEITAGYVVLGVVMTLSAFLSTAVIWEKDLPPQEQTDKAKREARDDMDALLRRLSDDELIALRDRLSTDEGQLYLSDDGELLRGR